MFKPKTAYLGGYNYFAEIDSLNKFTINLEKCFDYKLLSVPTYMIIDKEGKLVAYKAERPNTNGKLNTKIEK